MDMYVLCGCLKPMSCSDISWAMMDFFGFEIQTQKTLNYNNVANISHFFLIMLTAFFVLTLNSTPLISYCGNFVRAPLVYFLEPIAVIYKQLPSLISITKLTMKHLENV